MSASLNGIESGHKMCWISKMKCLSINWTEMKMIKLKWRVYHWFLSFHFVFIFQLHCNHAHIIPIQLMTFNVFGLACCMHQSGNNYNFANHCKRIIDKTVYVTNEMRCCWSGSSRISNVYELDQWYWLWVSSFDCTMSIWLQTQFYH